ncbi:hypothetical protein EYF80_054980 [Liparis tanakae]|uniref:Uncharacterized protein n=1 Tax=Liparis tanakae TaxID=230148 RepID=A0A4Z2F1F1_9TELE|nr:hypothetical protein EYF80_054980 [Liparis tanakae]
MFQEVASSKEAKEVAGDQGGGRMRSCSDGSRYSRRGVGLSNDSSSSTSSSSPVLYNPKSVLKRPVSTEELQRPGAFAKKTFTARRPLTSVLAAEPRPRERKDSIPESPPGFEKNSRPSALTELVETHSERKRISFL